MSQSRSATLHCSGGGSDKIYKAQIVPSGAGFMVNFQYGRRAPGSVATIHGGQAGSKTASPVPWNRAVTIFDQLIKSKTDKGYRHIDDPDAPQTGAATDEAVQQSHEAQKNKSAYEVMLLTPIDFETLQKLARNPAWCFQRKWDGVRRVLERAGETVNCVNRKGEYVGSAVARMADDAKLIRHPFVNDGEEIGDQQFAFDLLMLDGVDYRPKPMKERWMKLAEIAANCSRGGIVVTATAFSTAEKQQMIATAQAEKWEGIVVKMVSAPYEAGRAKTALKFKFKATATCQVTGHNFDKSGAQKRSVRLAVESDDNTGLVAIGNVTIPANFDIPEVGTFVEIEYLHCFPNGGNLYQPVYKGPRADKETADTYSSLKFKAAGEDEDEEAA